MGLGGTAVGVDGLEGVGPVGWRGMKGFEALGGRSVSESGMSNLEPERVMTGELGADCEKSLDVEVGASESIHLP
jgi:hypothetical protein